MGYILEVNQNTEQFDTLINAITTGASGWKTGASGVTTFNFTGLNAKEFLVIQKIQLPNNKYTSTTFTIPKNALLNVGTMIDGYYYNTNYYGTFGIKITSSTIENDSAWVRMQYGSGVVITTAILDIYYR